MVINTINRNYSFLNYNSTPQVSKNLNNKRFGAADNFSNKEENNNEKFKLKPLTLLGSILGTVSASAFVVSSTKKSKTIFSKILKTDFAKTKNIFLIASGSLMGGFTGGVVEDKGKNLWKKIKEANFQMLSNIALPLVFLTVFKNANEKLTKNSGKVVKNVGNFISVFAGVGTGAFTGAFFANQINKDILKPEDPHERRLGVKDFLIHVDDLPIALAFAGIPYIDKLIPFVLVTRGYDVGKQ